MAPLDWRGEIARRVRGECRPDEPLAPRTSIRVGGPAELLVRPADPDDLAALLAAVASLGIPLSVLGGGANTLVADAGVPGVVVRLPTEFGEERQDGDRLLLSAGAPMGRLSARGHALGLVGAEFSAGIPGTLGGATAMNAGTRLGEMKQLLTRVELATADGIGFLPAGALQLAYRRSELPAGAVVTRVELQLHPGDVAASRAAMEADLAHRRSTQPLHQPSFGSTFWNPPGRFAGQLIEAVGLKGHRVGGAMFSELHANFIVNLGTATARDVLALIRLARERVAERFGVQLETEVRRLGRFEEGEV
jgi:UDP-N-acetylmuramate dehydrogenase